LNSLVRSPMLMVICTEPLIFSESKASTRIVPVDFRFSRLH
jgi:hypothetical protein